jgi:hypothetical protein
MLYAIYYSCKIIKTSTLITHCSIAFLSLYIDAILTTRDGHKKCFCLTGYNSIINHCCHYYSTNTRATNTLLQQLQLRYCYSCIKMMMPMMQSKPPHEFYEVLHRLLFTPSPPSPDKSKKEWGSCTVVIIFRESYRERINLNSQRNLIQR